MTNPNTNGDEHDDTDEEYEETNNETNEEDNPFQDEDAPDGDTFGEVMGEIFEEMHRFSEELNERTQDTTGRVRVGPRSMEGRFGPFGFGMQHVKMRDEIDEENEVYRLYADLPGIDEGEMEVTATEDDVSITASNDTRDYDVSRTLPVRVNPDETTATYNNGVLEIVFPFADEEDEGRTITIN